MEANEINQESPFNKRLTAFVDLLKFPEAIDSWHDLFCLETTDGEEFSWEQVIGEDGNEITAYLEQNLQDGLPGIWSHPQFRRAIVTGQFFSWEDLHGLSELEAEELMFARLGYLPDEWVEDPQFRDQVTGIAGQSTHTAHMNFGIQAYEGGVLGKDAAEAWYLRNVADQGHPEEPPGFRDQVDSGKI